jgi:hypothetical protein
MGTEPLFRGAMPISTLFGFSAKSHAYLPLLATLFKLSLGHTYPDAARRAVSLGYLSLFLIRV